MPSITRGRNMQMKNGKKWKWEANMTGKWKRHALGEYKNKNKHIYIASAGKMVIWPNIMWCISGGAERSLRSCVHIYESGKLRAGASVQLRSCNFHVIPFPFNAVPRRPLIVLFQDVNTEWKEHIWPYWSWKSIILLNWKSFILMGINHTTYLSSTTLLLLLYHSLVWFCSSLALGDLPI